MATVEALSKGDQTAAYVPVGAQNATAVQDYAARVEKSMGRLPGMSTALNQTKAWEVQQNGKGGDLAEFSKRLEQNIETQQPLRDEVGNGMEIVRRHLRQLLDPTVEKDFHFSSGVRGEEIDKGGMGAVYQVALRGRKRAAKELLDPTVGGEQERRFIAEQEAMQILNGEICPQFDGVEIVDGKRHIVMEWIDGETLEKLVALKGPLPPKDAYGLLASLAAAHANLVNKFDIYHRDLKPKNIMINAKTGEVKIIDFGIMGRKASANENREHTKIGSVYGTPAFMSREQHADFTELDERNETFAFGANAYFVLTGKPPAPGAVGQHYRWNGEVDMSNVPAEVRPWLNSLLHSDRDKRMKLDEAGRFAFERSDHVKNFASWEDFLEANNARRTIDPKKLLGLEARPSSLEKTEKLPTNTTSQASASRILTKRNVIAATVGSIIIGGVAYFFSRGGDANIEEKKDNNPVPLKVDPFVQSSLEKNKGFTPLSFVPDEQGRRKIVFHGKDESKAKVDRAEIGTNKGVHFRRKDGSYLGARHSSDDPIIASLFNVDDKEKIPAKWQGRRSVSFEITNNGRSGFFISSVGIFLKKADGKIVVYAADSGKGLPIVQACGVGNIFGYQDRGMDPDYQALFSDLVTADLTEDVVEVGDIENFPQPRDPKDVPQKMWTKEQHLTAYTGWLGDEQAAISKAIAKARTP